jgi:hypothetical protein
MKKINTKFIAGMLAMALAFGMIGCDNGTNTVTKTVTVPGGQTPGANVPITGLPANGSDAVKAFLKEQLGSNVKTLYITSPITLNGSYTLGSGKTIVVTDDDLPANLNTLALPNAGALFAIGNPSGKASLTVNGILTLGGKLVLGSEMDSTKSGELLIADNSTVAVAKGASVTATTASRIELAAKSSGFIYEAASLGEEGTLNIVGSLDTAAGEKVDGTERNTAILVYPAHAESEKPNITLGKENVTINGRPAENTDFSNPDGYTSESAAASTPSAVDTAFKNNTAKEVFYSGTESLGTIEVPDNKTLVVAGDLTQTGTLTVKGALEIAPGAEVTVSGASGKLTAGEGAAIAIPEGATLTVSGSGEVDISALYAGAVEGEPSVSLEGDIVVGSGGTLKIGSGNGASLPPEVDFSAGGSITIANGGRVTLTDNTVYVGEDPTALYQWTDNTPSSITLAEGSLAMSGKITANDPPSIGGGVTATIESGTLTVKGSAATPATLTLDAGAKLVIEDEATIAVADKGILDLTALYVADVSGGSTAAGDLNGVVTINGMIEVASGGTFKSPAPSLADEVVYGNEGKLKLNAGSKAFIGPYQYIGTSAEGATAVYTWTESSPTEGYVTIGNAGMTLGGNGNLSSGAESNTVTGKLTIENGATLTVNPGAAEDANFKVGDNQSSAAELVVEGTVELNQRGYLTIYPTAKLSVKSTGTITHTGTATSVGVIVFGNNQVNEAVATTVTVTGNQNDGWNVTSSGTDALNIKLGKVTITSTGTDAVNYVTLGTANPAADGSLTAGTLTHILFAGRP